MKVFSAWTYRQVAEAMGISEGAAKAHLHQAVANLRRWMGRLARIFVARRARAAKLSCEVRMVDCSKNVNRKRTLCKQLCDKRTLWSSHRSDTLRSIA